MTEFGSFDLTTGSALALVVAGFLAGAINAVVGAGTLLTYATLIAVGVPPVAANATNTSGIFVGSMASVFAYRRELSGKWRRLLFPAMASVAGASFGVWLVLSLPEKVFGTVVPWLIGGAALLVAVQPVLVARAIRRGTHNPRHRPARLVAGAGGVGVYGGYFGAAQGVLLMALLGATYDRDLQQANAAKNVLATVANLTAAIVFVAVGRVLWLPALCIAAGALLGGASGGAVARRLPASVMRVVVVAIGLGAAVLVYVETRHA